MSVQLARSTDHSGTFAVPNHERDLRLLKDVGVKFVLVQTVFPTCFNPHCAAVPSLVAKRGKFVTRCCSALRCQIMAARHSEMLYRSAYTPAPGYEPLGSPYASGFRRSDAPDLRPLQPRRSLISSDWLASMLPELAALQGGVNPSIRH